MKKQYQLPLFALFVALVVAYAYFVEFKGIQRKQEQSRILQIEPSAIQKVTLTNNNVQSDDKSIILERETKEDQQNTKDEEFPALDTWQMTTPLNDLADDFAISSLIESLTDEKSDIKIPLDKSNENGVSLQEGMKKYGLDDPIGSFQVTLKDNSTHSVKVGRTKGLNDKTYLLRDNNDIWVGSSWWRTELEKRPDEFRNKKVISFHNPKKLHIIHKTKQDNQDFSTEALEFIKTEEDQWHLQGQKRDIVEDYLQKLKDLQIQEFVSEDIADFDNWILNITVQEQDQEDFHHQLQMISSEDDSAYIFSTPRQIFVKVSKSSVENLIKGIADLKKPPVTLTPSIAPTPNTTEQATEDSEDKSQNKTE